MSVITFMRGPTYITRLAICLTRIFAALLSVRAIALKWITNTSCSAHFVAYYPTSNLLALLVTCRVNWLLVAILLRSEDSCRLSIHFVLQIISSIVDRSCQLWMRRFQSFIFIYLAALSHVFHMCQKAKYHFSYNDCNKSESQSS